jgi:hypothetical protein
MEETPRSAHLMVLLLLGTGLGIITGLILVFFGTVRKAKLLTKCGGALVLLCATGYGMLLLGTGILSSDKTLAEGEWKYFCEPDCHIAYSVASVQTVAELGTEANPYQANGQYVLVRLKSWFDEKSVSKFRGNGPLTPVPRVVSLVDITGRRFPAESKPSVMGDVSTPLTEPVRPGESYLTTFVFDVPKDARDLRLLITDDDPISVVTIDHENSPFHGKIYLSLRPSTRTTALSSH